MEINQIDIEHIERLNAFQLTKLLHSLLQIELEKNEINGDAFVPFNITTGDAGDDGRVQWIGERINTKWFKNQFCLFQNKATNLGPKACYNEILKPIETGKSKSLKPNIEKLVRTNGCYVLFTNKSLNTKLKNERIDKFRKAIKDAGFENYNTIQIKVYDTNSIKDWVNENIGSVTLVQQFNDITRPGFRLWEQWEKTLEGSSIPYKRNDTINQHIQNIYESLQQNRPIRIIGHSGLGKTRLVLETFRQDSLNTNIEGLQKQLVYFEIGVNGTLKDLSNYILNHTNQEGILVIDSCNEETHKVLSGLVNSMGKFKLISIDIASSTQEESSFKLDREYQRDVVEEIVNEMLGDSHSQSDRDYLNNICEGYPWMAVKFCISIQKNGIADFSGSLPREFIKRLLFGRNKENEIEYNIIRACSVFSTFGFLDDELQLILNEEHKKSLEKQMEFVRTKIYDGVLTEGKFYEICQKYRGKDIIEKRGTQYIVKPTILAINLASDWLLNTPPEKIVSIIKSLKGDSLSQKFVERLKDLDQLDKAQNIVHELWGPNSPFGSAEVLNTEWGSLLFRYVVEVNPLSTVKALRDSIEKLSKEGIKDVKEGRRNLVWSLEKLCFRKETFSIAAKVLFAFAVSENETYGNNSENQFCQLYQLFLSGTEADLNERIEIIKWGLAKKDDDYNRIAINALGRGVYTDQYARSGGAENQGSKAPLKDNNPTWEEIFDFWDSSLLILTNFACSDDANSELAKSKLANYFRSLIRCGKTELVINAVLKVTSNSESIWFEGINALKQALRFEKVPNKISEKINSLIKEITPIGIKHQLHIIVTKPGWDTYEKDEDGHYIDKPKLKAEELAEKIKDEDIDWYNYLPDLLSGEQRQSFNFGKKLGELHYNKEEFLSIVFEALALIPENERNIDLIGGFINGSKDEKLKVKAIDFTLKNKSFNQLAFYLTRVSNPRLSDLEKLFEIIGETKLPISQFKNFQYGRALDNLNVTEVITLCQKISNYGKEGLWTALSLIYMYCYDDKNRRDKCNSIVREIISKENMLIEESKVGIIEHDHWSDSVNKILTNSKDNEFAKVVSSQIIEYCSQPNFNYSFDSYLKETLRILLDNYYESIWPIIGNGLIGDYSTYRHLKHMLGTRNGSWGHIGHLFQNPELNNKILDWIRLHSDIAPVRIANMMPIESADQDQIIWHPFSKAVIDEFGDDDDFLTSISANMGSYGMTGSSVPYYKKQRTLLEQLSDHQSAKIQGWVEQMIEYTDQRIKREQLADEEQFL